MMTEDAIGSFTPGTDTVFVNGDWSLASLPRLVANRPYKHLGVWITPPKPLMKMINQSGPLDSQAVQQLGRKLDLVLVAA